MNILNKLTIVIFLSAGIIFSGAVSPVLADSCQPIYGGGVSCPSTNLVINKTVQNPQNNTFVDNLGLNDPKFSNGNTITFHIQVTNSGSTSVNNVQVKDTLPSLVNFTSADQSGSYDSTNRVVTWSAGTLNPNDSRTYTLVGQVTTNNFPSGQTTVCGSSNGQNYAVNQSFVTADNQPQQQDNASFCVQTGLTVFPAPSVASTPSTGPEALGLLGLIPAGLTGFFLRKKTSK